MLKAIKYLIWEDKEKGDRTKEKNGRKWHINFLSYPKVECFYKMNTSIEVFKVKVENKSHIDVHSCGNIFLIFPETKNYINIPIISNNA